MTKQQLIDLGAKQVSDATNSLKIFGLWFWATESIVQAVKDAGEQVSKSGPTWSGRFAAQQGLDGFAPYTLYFKG